MPRQTNIQIRRGAASDWANVNPTLAAGEMAVEQDTFKIKVGDGSTAWNNLQYVRLDGGSLDGGVGATTTTAAPTTTTTAAPGATVPGAPTNLVVELYGTGVALNWTDPASNGGSAITGYVVQFSTNGGNTWTTTTLSPLSGYRGYFDGDLEMFSHRFRVAATNSVGTGSYSEPSDDMGGPG